MLLKLCVFTCRIDPATFFVTQFKDWWSVIFCNRIFIRPGQLAERHRRQDNNVFMTVDAMESVDGVFPS